MEETNTMLKGIMISIFVLGYLVELGLISYFMIDNAKDITNDVFTIGDKISDYLWFIILYLIMCFSISFTILLGYLSLKVYCIICAITFVYFNIIYLFNIDWKMIFKK